ncbi:MAG: phosphatase [Gammaproteobacteria bacterium]|nr:MAG: phosphatase [Gammaproteobacteria bacterium]
MTHRQQAHAQHVVAGFRALVEQAGASGVTEEHWKELALLVEGAIDAALLEKLEPIADRMEALATEVRREAERVNRTA